MRMMLNLSRITTNTCGASSRITTANNRILSAAFGPRNQMFNVLQGAFMNELTNERKCVKSSAQTGKDY